MLNFFRVQRRVLNTRALAFRKLPIPPRLLFYQSRYFCKKDDSLYHSPLGNWFLTERSITETRKLSISDFCGHMSFVILAISFICSELLHLRIVAFFAGMSMATFNYFHPNGRPLWLPFRWNILFLLINSGWIFYLLKQQYDANHLKQYENWLYEEVFEQTGMKRVEFLKLVRVGELKIYNEGEHLTTQGLKSFWVQILIEGVGQAEVNGKNVYQVTPGNFISELGIHSGIRNREQNSSASIIAKDVCVSIRWSRGALIDIMEQKPEIGASVQAAMTADLIKKMNRSAKELSAATTEGEEDWYGNMDYQQILKGILSRNVITKRERNMLKRYRKMHFIDEKTHEAFVHENGWSIGEFDFGQKFGKDGSHGPAPSEINDVDMNQLVLEYLKSRRANSEDDMLNPLLDDEIMR